MSIQLITVRFDNGESITMNQIDVMIFGKDGGIIGHCGLEEFRDFLKDKLTDIKTDEAK